MSDDHKPTIMATVMKMIDDHPEMFDEQKDPNNLHPRHNWHIEDAVLAVRLHRGTRNVEEAIAESEKVMAHVRAILKSLEPRHWNDDWVNIMRKELSKDWWYHGCNNSWRTEEPNY